MITVAVIDSGGNNDNDDKDVKGGSGDADDMVKVFLMMTITQHVL